MQASNFYYAPKKTSSLILLLLCTFLSFAQKDKSAKQAYVLLGDKVMSSQDSSLVESLFYSGLKEKIAQNNKLAIEYFERITTLDPANEDAYYELAQLYFQGKDLPKAKENIEKATTIKTDNNWYWILSAGIYQEQQDYNLLNYALDELIKLSPDKISYQMDKANTLMMLKKTEEALKVYENLEKKYGLTEDIIEGKQRLYISGGDYKAAETDLNLLLSKDPNNVNYYIRLGDLYYNNKDTEKALKAYNQVKLLDPSNVYVNLALADIYNKEGKPEQAFNELASAFSHQELEIDQKIKVILSYFASFPDTNAVNYADKLAKIITETHPDDPKAFAIYGDVLFQQNKLEEAKVAYEKALELNKQVYAVWDQLIRIDLGLNNLDAVIKNGEEALTYFPNQAMLYFYTAIAYTQQKKSDKAIAYLKNTLNYDLQTPLKIQVYSSLGDAYEEIKKYKESAAAYEQALALDANNAYALNNYAYYLSLREENLEKAAEMSLKSNELSPNNASFLDTYAWILFRQKKYAEAKEWMQKALDASKSASAVMLEHYGDILYHLGEKEEAINNWKKAIAMGEKSSLLQKKVNEKKYFE